MDLFNDAMKQLNRSNGKVEYSTKYNGDQSLTFTPVWVVNEMLDMLPDQIWNEHTTFLDISCKTGVFLVEIFKRLDKKLKNIPEFEDDKVRREYILNKQLYGLTLDDNMSLMMSRRNLTGNAFSGNIKYIGYSNKSYIDIIKSRNEKILKDLVKEEFGQMNFDVVVGNPPYNRGMDLDFVRGGWNLSNRWVSMITPAKWKTADANQNIASETVTYGQFRKTYMPHMTDIIFWINSLDAFGTIYQIDGISAYLMDKNNIPEKTSITNKCASNKYLRTQSYRNIVNTGSLINQFDEIYECVSKNKKYKQFCISSIINSSPLGERYQLWCNTQMPGNQATNSKGKAYGLGKLQLIDRNIQEPSRLTDIKCIYTSNKYQQCLSVKSFLDCKFTRFWLFCNISKLNNTLVDWYFRFVPAPPSGKFDHIYTDQELYDAFNLPQKYRDVIEAVVAERK